MFSAYFCICNSEAGFSYYVIWHSLFVIIEEGGEEKRVGEYGSTLLPLVWKVLGKLCYVVILPSESFINLSNWCCSSRLMTGVNIIIYVDNL